VDFIVIFLLRVDGVAEYPEHDVIGGEKLIGTPANRPSGEVEVDHFFLLHSLVSEMDPEDVEVVGAAS
jgi:hypothetical protein